MASHIWQPLVRTPTAAIFISILLFQISNRHSTALPDQQDAHTPEIRVFFGSTITILRRPEGVAHSGQTDCSQHDQAPPHPEGLCSIWRLLCCRYRDRNHRGRWLSQRGELVSKAACCLTCKRYRFFKTCPARVQWWEMFFKAARTAKSMPGSILRTLILALSQSVATTSGFLIS